MAEAAAIRSALTMITSEVTFLWGVRDEVEWIKAEVRIKFVAERRVSYNIENILDQESSFTSENLREQRQSSVHIGEMAIVGLEEDLKKLKGILIGEDLELRVISIVGMGGIAFNIEEIMREIEKQVNIYSGRKAEMAM
ncbi:hypothetical protein GIB67_023813 [Kingdonia uniflora]|uniref:Uncharacterized protein n=1 Tax=Kingdonia uniflora TaxID=39325 RepID=A0A7J7NGB9_9MAGN|nr:hypothetical protein GIB67_023813 [Kingdonia uniflora]